MKKIYMITPFMPLDGNIRAFKIAEILNKCDIGLQSLGWQRVRDQKIKSSFDIDEGRLLVGGGRGKSAWALYPAWMLVVFLWVAANGRNKILYCYGWETAFPACAANFITRAGATILFDDADRFSLSINFPNLVRRIISFFERWTSKSAFLHIVPTFARYEWKHTSMVEIPNMPMITDYDLIQSESSCFNKLASPNPFTIYINGWLVDTRGVKTYLEAIEILKKRNRNFNVIIAGPKEDSEAFKKLVGESNVTYLGQLNRIKAMELYQHANVVLTFYDPVIHINRYAQSNKWGDCVYFNTPFIVNSEVVTAKDYVSMGAALSCSYSDSAALADILYGLMSDPSMSDRVKKSLSGLKGKFAFFDVAIKEKILSKLKLEY